MASARYKERLSCGTASQNERYKRNLIVVNTSVGMCILSDICEQLKKTIRLSFFIRAHEHLTPIRRA
jgi:hypothetical protein